MITISPFKALRPEAQLAKQVASRPYDVLNSKEAKIEAQGNHSSFLHITKSEIDLPESVDIHSQEVYDKAKEKEIKNIKNAFNYGQTDPGMEADEYLDFINFK